MSQLSQAIFGSQTVTSQTYTQELDDSTFALLTSPQDDSVYGLLFPRKPFLKTIELKTGETYTFGRSPNCTEQFLEKDFSPSSSYMTLSFTHFQITRQQICSGSDVQAIIQDLSSNGTYLNRAKIGKNKFKVLAHNDVISLLNPDFEVYIYTDAKITEKPEIPIEVRRDYAVSRKLGNGAQGQVFLCINKATAEQCAIKQILKADNRNVLNEVNILKKLQHSHIVHMQGYIESPYAVFIIMEYMACDLEALLAEREYLEETESKVVFYQIAQAVEYLHSNRIIHRDLKPANTLLLSKEILFVKLTDFGLSKHNTTITSPDTFCGTAGFVAPEVIRTLKTGIPYNTQIDVWSLGVVLFYCLSGTKPFARTETEPAHVRILKGRFSFYAERWQVISYEAKTLISEMFKVDPEQRITIRNLYRHPWISQDPNLESHLCELHSQVTRKS
ncbi:unnamed protein product [Bemisia tabaci]|uniref:Uncharacterized protein n=1 Tax=Bemisia tabaci TaxID=7038 RepID=A0A9P0A179_BEMTA|nr:unnamed protein product [Bemisia tabaci]